MRATRPGGQAAITLPPFDLRATWSVSVVDAVGGGVLVEHQPDAVCETASIGKIFLLIEVARRLSTGQVSPDARIDIPAEHLVEDSGLLYRMRDPRVTVADAALLVGAVSDNLATNALLHLCGLDVVRGVAPALGYRDTALLDYIRDVRTPDLPPTPSSGTGAELADLMQRLGTGEVISREVSTQVLSWLAADADTSMVAAPLLVDPLAHVEAEHQGILLRHKTGSTQTVRADVGYVEGPQASVAYAVLADWKNAGADLRAAVLDAMWAIGESLRAHVTGLARTPLAVPSMPEDVAR